MPFLSRVRSAVRYLSWSDSVYKWKLSRSKCPACGGRAFLSLKRSDFLTRCLSCRANAVNLSLIPVIEEAFGPQSRDANAYELSTFGATHDYLQRNFGQVTFSEYMPDEAMGSIINGVLNEDVQNLTFKNESFDLITSNQVMEHVPDDIRGFQECFRTLKPGGRLIFTVPLYDTPHTIQMAEIRPDGIHFLQEPEYHDSRLGGPKSALVFWRHSRNDLCDRLRMAGFPAVELVQVMIAPSQGAPTGVVRATK